MIPMGFKGHNMAEKYGWDEPQKKWVVPRCWSKDYEDEEETY